ncbi:MAG: MiaB/RimO family radical SAM methylthiotransferase, partial [Pseudomonadota bacterium]
RPVDAVVAEAQGLVDQGVREVTLLGQNVNAYHGIDGDTGAQASLAALLNRLAAIDGLARIRYTTSHPNDMTDDLFAAHGALDKLMPYLHLPFQAGSDRMLAAMNRRHTVAQYRDVIARMRDARPDLALSTDIIVGFPGETDADFQGTLDLVDEITFAQAFSFKYSSRPGTPAARMDGAVAEEVKTERLAILQAKLRAQQAEFNASCVGRKLPVLFEKAGRLPGQLVGRSPYLQPVHADGGPELIGTIADVSITATQPNSLGGVINAGDAQPRATAA